jgi:ribosomal protein S18 acetylase RimI-like enzyme
MNVSAAGDSDVNGMVVVHRDAFRDFFLTSLGDRFLRRFYAATVREPTALSFVGRVGGEIAGFVVGTTQPSRFFRRLLLRQGMGFCLDALGALVRRPWYVSKRLLRGVTYRGEPPPAYRADAALVSSIAVLPTAAGTGLGTALLDAFCAAAAQRGASSVYLLTDREGNEAVNRFYLKAGFLLETELVRQGERSMNRYIRDLRENPIR